MKRRLRMGMVGGTMEAFIGEVHRKAARMDGRIDIVAGTFSRNPAKSRATGASLGLDPNRVYATVDEMICREADRPANDRLDFISVVTPNVAHFEPVKQALLAGFHVVCEKPLAFSLDQGLAIRKLVTKTRRRFMVTYNYTGYPMVKEARALVRQGEIGRILKVVIEYPQGWLIRLAQANARKEAGGIDLWRTDPRIAGISNCMGDIGTHCENMLHYVTGLEIKSLCADLTAFGAGNRLDNDGNVLLRLRGGAKGVLHASQISFGEENGFNFRIYGDHGRLAWRQEDPNYLLVQKEGMPAMTYSRGNAYLSPAARRANRIPCGHPEAFIEAFANLYRNFADTLSAIDEGRKPTEIEADFPTVDDGVRGLRFVRAVVQNGCNDKVKWTNLK